MKRAAALLIALCLIWGAAFAETVFAEEEFAAVEEEFAAVEEVFAVESEEEPVEALPEETTAALKDIGSQCVVGEIEAVTVRVPDSTIKIRRTKRGISVSRMKALSATLEA